MPRRMMMVAVVCQLGILAGCATTGGGGDPADEARAALEAYHAALVAGDLEELVDRFSDNFSNDAGVPKAKVRRFFERLVSANAFDGVESNMENSRFEAIGNLVNVSLVTYSVGGVTARCGYMMKKEADGKWRITFTSSTEVGRYLAHQW